MCKLCIMLLQATIKYIRRRKKKKKKKKSKQNHNNLFLFC